MIIVPGKKPKPEPPLVTHNEDGTLTREGALLEARKRWGDLGQICSDDVLPKFVWEVGNMKATLGQGTTWEQCFAQSDGRKK